MRLVPRGPVAVLALRAPEIVFEGNGLVGSPPFSTWLSLLFDPPLLDELDELPLFPLAKLDDSLGGFLTVCKIMYIKILQSSVNRLKKS